MVWLSKIIFQLTRLSVMPVLKNCIICLKGKASLRVLSLYEFMLFRRPKGTRKNPRNGYFIVDYDY